MNEILTFSLACTALMVFINAVYDSSRNIENHTSRWIIRTVLMAFFSTLNWKIFLMNTALFILFFDYTYNYFRGKRWYYIGNTALWDRFWLRYGANKLLAFRIIYAITCIITYIKL